MQFQQGGPDSRAARQRTATMHRIPGSSAKAPIEFHKSVKPPHDA
jgi:hypothetical protein